MNALEQLRERWSNRRPWREEVRHFLNAPATVDNTDRLRSILGHLILLRLAIVLAIFGVVTWQLLTSNIWTSLNAVYYPLGVVFALSGINALLLRWMTRLRPLGYAQIAVDLILSSLALYVSNSTVSSFLYLLVILEAAILFRKHAAVVVASLSALCYSLLESGLIDRFDGTPVSVNMVDISLVYLSFVIIGLVGAYLADHVRALGNLAESHAKDLTELTQQQQNLFENISEGIITLDLNAVVTGVNQAAKAILALSTLNVEELVGQKLPTVLRSVGVTEPDKLLEHAAALSNPAELSIGTEHQGQEVHLSYVVKPMVDAAGNENGKLLIFSDVSRVKDMEERLLLHEKMTKLMANAPAPQLTEKSYQHLQIIGESPVMKHIFALIERVAQSDASVLITGESGTGKELIAKAIHGRGPRALKPFVAINCGAIPENLLESEFFGHKKGSFTGAISDNPGLFRQANGGTIFLDEIGELPLHLQTKLLRVLQERKVRAVGDVHDVAVDVRVLAATNKDLKKEITGGRFREDLFYRLNVVNVIVPPLRDRREDIALLVRYFIGRFADQDRVLPQVSPEAVQLLVNYSFPGNIRELENIIERALVLGGQAILPEHLPNEVRSFKKPAARPAEGAGTQILVLPIDLEGELDRLEKELLLKALEQSGGVKKAAAELLGLNFRSLRYRLKKFGLGEEHADESNDNQ